MSIITIILIIAVAALLSSFFGYLSILYDEIKNLDVTRSIDEGDVHISHKS
jgi:hypothetical protein